MSSFRIQSSLRRATLLLLALLFTASVAVSQVTTGSLQGVVKDPNQAVVAGASVKVTNGDTGQVKETTTNGDGFYRVTNLQPGDNYRIDISSSGFTPAFVEKVAVRLGTENSADVAFSQVVGATGSVTVTGETSLIQSTQSQLSTSYSPQQLTQLPFNGGSIDNLALLTPGVATPGDADFTNGVGISSNGNRGRSNNFQIDGQDNNDNSVAGPSLTLTNTEAIGEYQVITNNFSAEFGRNAGAQINTITKPGTNEFHGALFEYIQNSALNARNNIEKKAQQGFKFLGDNLGGPQGTFFKNYAVNRQGQDPFTYNRFGGAVGGPLRKNKAFFFVTYQGDRQRGEQDTNNFTFGDLILTPDSVAAIRASGNFPIGSAIVGSSAIGGYPSSVQGAGTLIIVPPMLDTNGDGIPDTFAYAPGNPFGNIPTANRLSDVAYIRSGGPTSPIIPLFAGEAVRILRNDYSEDQLITREDFNITDKDIVSARYIYDNTKFPLATGRFLAGAIFDVPSKNNNLGVSYTRTISPRTTNEARFNFSRLTVLFGDPATAKPGPGGNPGPGIQFSGTRTLNFDLLTTFGTQNNLPQSRRVDVWQEQDTVSSTLGNHAVKVGADIRQQRVNNFFLPNFLGTYVFNGGNPFLAFTPGGATSLPAGPVPANTFFFDTFGGPGSDRGVAGTCAAVNPCRASALENMLLGRPREIRFALGTASTNTKQDDYFFFIQDDWRIRPNLTLNLGARYEISTTPFNPIIEQVNKREADASAALFNTSFPLSTRTATELPLDKNNWAPRVGFAWSPDIHWLGDRFSNGHSVIRGGFSLAYDPSFFNIVLNTITAAPFAVAGVIRQNPGAVGSVNFPFLPTTRAEASLTPGTNGGDPRLFNQTRVDPKFYNPYTVGWNFGIQQELFKNNVLEVRYVGSHIVGQFQTVNGNPDLRNLANAGQFLFGDPTRFTHGVAVTSCVGADPTCVAPTSANGFNSRSNDATGNLITGSGRVNPLSGPTRTRINGAESLYHSLQVRYDSRLSNSLVLNANYTLSKNIDNASEIFSTGGGGQGVADPQDPFDWTKGERGLSAFHQKHNFTANFIYDLPFSREQRGALGHIIGGWQLSGIIRAGSGRPYTPLEAFNTYDPSMENAFFGIGALRPFNGNPNAPNGTIAFGVTAACSVLFGDPGCNSPNAVAGNFILYNTLNPGSAGTAVTPAQALQQARVIYNDFGLNNQFGVPLASLEAFNLFKTPFGNVGRNTFTGLPFYLLNMSVFKTTKISERTKLEFRAEANNLLNRRNFGVPDAFTEDASNGFAVSSYQNPGFNNGSRRELRMGLRFIF